MAVLENNFSYKEIFKIRTYDVDINRELKPSALYGYMQEAATIHAELLGLGYEDLNERGMLWVVGRLRYDLERMPKLDEEIEVRTWPAGVDGVCALRRFEFVIKGEKIGQGLSYWLMLSSQRMRPVRLDYFNEQIKDLPIGSDDFFKMPKIQLPQDMAYAYEQGMRNSDLDWNHHVNNIRYSAFVYNSLPLEMLQSHEVLGLQIDYLKEIKHGDTVVISTSMVESQWFVKGEVDGKVMFAAVAELGPKS